MEAAIAAKEEMERVKPKWRNPEHCKRKPGERTPADDRGTPIVFHPEDKGWVPYVSDCLTHAYGEDSDTPRHIARTILDACAYNDAKNEELRTSGGAASSSGVKRERDEKKEELRRSGGAASSSGVKRGSADRKRKRTAPGGKDASTEDAEKHGCDWT